MLRLALPRGRLFAETVELLLSRGVLNEKLEEGRKLFIKTGSLEVMLVKPSDVPVYVEGGVADLGVCGMDVLLERKPSVYRLLDLGLGYCKVVVAGRPESLTRYPNLSHLKVATKYPRLAREFFTKRGVKAEVYYLSGSVELAPLVGLAEFILDLVQTGRTLKENGLVIVEEVAESTAWLIANKDSFRTKNAAVLELVRKLKGDGP